MELRQKGTPRWVPFILAIFFFAASSMVFISLKVARKPILATIEGEPLYTEEFQLLMLQYRGEASQYFYETYGAEFGPNFWTTPFGGTTPLEYLKQLAWKQALANKIMQIRAKREHIADDIDFYHLMKQWSSEMERRDQTRESGGLLFGPSDFTLPEFCRYLENGWSSELYKKYVEEFTPTTDEIQSFYEENRESLYRLDCRVTVCATSFAYSSAEAQTKAWQDANDFRAALLSGADPTALMEQYPDGQNDLLILDSNQTGTDKAGMGRKRWNAASKLLPGDVSAVVAEGNCYWVLQCVERNSGVYQSLEEVRQDIIYRIQEMNFKSQLAQEVRNADVVIDYAQWNQISEEGFS